MEFKEILKRRTIRLFQQRPVPQSELRQLLEAARVASCGGNSQALRYIVVRETEPVKAILPHTRYAARIKPYRDPVWGETAPPVFLAVTSAGPERSVLYADAGAAIQSLEFAAWELGIGCCWIGSFDREPVRRILEIPEDDLLLFLVAVGYPAEAPVREDIPASGEVAYYLDENNTLHVPKYEVDAVTTWR